jgi:hypothetical protein
MRGIRTGTAIHARLWYARPSTPWGLLVPLLGASKSTPLGVKGAAPLIEIKGLALAEE